MPASRAVSNMRSQPTAALEERRRAATMICTTAPSPGPLALRKDERRAGALEQRLGDEQAEAQAAAGARCPGASTCRARRCGR